MVRPIGRDMVKRISFIIGAFTSIFAGYRLIGQEPSNRDDAPICPVCRQDAELIDNGIYACKVVGCGVLFRDNKPKEDK